MMAPLALCAVVLALAGPSARAGHALGAPADQTGLFQISKGSAETYSNTDQGVLAEEEGGLSDQAAYSEDYKVGMLVETRMPNGTWVPAALQGLHDEHVEDVEDVWDLKIPGQDLQGVPTKLLRRRLDEGESDWFVVNKGPEQLAGVSGVAYRLSKNLKDVAGMTYAPFNSLVVGRDEADGWLKVSRGYLPMRVNGVQVLAKRDRRGTVALTKEVRDWYLEAEEDRLETAMAKLALVPPPLQSYAESEEVLFQTSDGEWRPARVVSVEFAAYKVLVRPRRGSEYEVSRVHPAQLRKAGPPKQHSSIKGESPACQKAGGCVELLLKADSGKEHKVQAGLGTPIHFLMKVACGVIHSPRSCMTRIQLRHLGLLSPSWRTFEAGLANGTVVDMKLAPESVTPMGEVSA